LAMMNLHNLSIIDVVAVMEAENAHGVQGVGRKRMRLVSPNMSPMIVGIATVREDAKPVQVRGVDIEKISSVQKNG